ncbi:lipoprotein insertase outer membrane protein LolB [Nitrosococcus wardiae]|uniref:Outer-membrane lipoprotein LolB n=1 Tax=Nitrosococcus wardiae TaxID=1814290 RepID=A0A4P7BV11_9GAMM|nr:lipoprotein insertase outer membrane protein LolB [Nitrosococcus wardiae]QBQ53818.1 lipoprotein localization protein LolB [Nitrosococcus wardiae]
MRQAKLSIIGVLIIALLAGCTPLRKPPPPFDPEHTWQKRQLALRKLGGWKLKGRLAIDAIQEAWTGTLRWVQKGDKFEILWISPLGQGSVELRGNPERVTLRVPKEAPITAESAEKLLGIRLGWSLPVSGLRYWLLGLPAPGLPVLSRSLDPFGRLHSLSQGGWQIRYLGYQSVKNYQLPGKVFLDNPKLRLRLVIDRWHLV